MTIEYRIKIEGETHRIRIEAPEENTEESLEELREFAISTAYLEHFGYLPKGVLNSTD
ncbi:MAG: hypothetical protein ACE5JH_07955 [Acidobacteriota bacterium]